MVNQREGNQAVGIFFHKKHPDLLLHTLSIASSLAYVLLTVEPHSVLRPIAVVSKCKHCSSKYFSCS